MKSLTKLIMTIIILSITQSACGSQASTNDSLSPEEINTIAAATVSAFLGTPPSEVLSTQKPDINSTVSTGSTNAFIIVISDSVVRSGPSLEYPVLQVIGKGTTIKAFKVSSNKEWISLDENDISWILLSKVTLNVDANELPIATTSLYAPTITPLPPVTLEDIYANFDKMTELQFSEYQKTIIGKSIQQKVKIGNVNDKGVVSLLGEWSPTIINLTEFCVIVNNVPREIAINLNGGDEHYLQANINGIVGNYNYYYNCENTLVLVYGSLTG